MKTNRPPKKNVLLPPSKPCNAFTLIELLVVIAIISLLVSILLPSLNRAKDLAKGVVCLNGLRGAGVAFNTYASANNGYLPGPNTSGLGLDWGSSGTRPGRTGSDSGDSPSKPIYRDDWMSPIFADEFGLSGNRTERLLQLVEDHFVCPANNKNYDGLYQNGLGISTDKTVRVVSYSSPLTFHMYPNAANCPTNGWSLNQYDAAQVDMKPAGHRFRIDTMGKPSIKVAAMDGARYLSTDGKITLYAGGDAGNVEGTNFMSRGPCLNARYAQSGSPYKFASDGVSLSELAEEFAYRHSAKLNMVFFDGHAGSFDHVSSRKADYWFPSGTVVTDPSLLGDLNVRRGYQVE